MIEERVKAHSFSQIIGLGFLYIFMKISLKKYHFSLHKGSWVNPKCFQGTTEYEAGIRG